MVMNSRFTFVFISIAVVTAACNSSDDNNTGAGSNPVVEDERGSVGPGNPATYYCVELGYKAPAGGSDCIFPDGTSCEQWAFWRAECGQSHSFCASKGGTVKSEEFVFASDAGTFTTIEPICTMPDGKKCKEHDFRKTSKCE